MEQLLPIKSKNVLKRNSFYNAIEITEGKCWYKYMKHISHSNIIIEMNIVKHIMYEFEGALSIWQHTYQIPYTLAFDSCSCA